MKTVLVTGCAGFVGSAFARTLLARGDRVIGLDDCSRGSPGAIADLHDSSRFSFVQGDIRSKRDLERAFEQRPLAVVHLAARHFIPECMADPAGTLDINVVGTERVWQAANAYGVSRFIFT